MESWVELSLLSCFLYLYLYVHVTIIKTIYVSLSPIVKLLLKYKIICQGLEFHWTAVQKISICPVKYQELVTPLSNISDVGQVLLCRM